MILVCCGIYQSIIFATKIHYLNEPFLQLHMLCAIAQLVCTSAQTDHLRNFENVPFERLHTWSVCAVVQRVPVCNCAYGPCNYVTNNFSIFNMLVSVSGSVSPAQIVPSHVDEAAVWCMPGVCALYAVVTFALCTLTVKIFTPPSAALGH